MTENTEAETTRANLANLSKIPATEFEKHFHEWMERDDVARGLQAKLRCDLIKNFNSTNLGKQMMAHTMSSTGGSTYRLTLSPLILALNTLVAEFLYAQNCHFTLSVFCTEIPFRNTLPDFDCMRNFRFNEREINDIWEAVTGSVANKRCLDATVLEEYETNPQNSLLLLFLKSLLDMKPLEMLRKSVEIQTDCDSAYREQNQRSTHEQATQQSPAKSPAKSPDNLRHINKYLLILSQKVNEMTHEFELLVKQRNIRKPQQQTARKSTRSRELYTLNRSLDRINENVKQLTKSKRKGKRLTNVVESIDSLTKQFGKCAESFGQVTKELSKKEKRLTTPKVNFKEKQTETEAQDKTYADWIHEMRTTDNGKKFLERVENSLNKAVAKRKDQWQNETDAKLKNMKSLIKLHYKQKMQTHLTRQGSEERTDEARKLNESIEMRLKQFEVKQLELVEKLRESSFELQEAQKQLHEQTQLSEEFIPMEIEKGRELEKQHDQLVHENFSENEEKIKSPKTLVVNNQPAVDENTLDNKELVITQKQLLEMIDVVTPRDHNVDRLITDAKLRLQQLETESNCLEQHFQIYLERRKHEYQSRLESTHNLITQCQNKSSEIFRGIGQKERAAESVQGEWVLRSKHSKPPCPVADDLDFDVEFLRLQEKLKDTQLQVKRNDNNNSTSSSSVVLTNAILEAKQKFFENEELFRKRKERELMQFHNMTSLEEDNGRDLPTLGPFSYIHEYTSNSNALPTSGKEQIIGFNINYNVSNLGKTQTTDDIEPEGKTIPKSANIQIYKESEKEAVSNDANKKSPRRELFPIESKSAQDISKTIEIIRYHEPISMTNRDFRQALKDLKTYTQNMEKKDSRTAESTAELIKQSMAKMKQLFEVQTKDDTKETDPKPPVPNNCKDTHVSTFKEYLDLNTPDINHTTSTTPTSHTETTTTSAISSSVDVVSKRQLNMLNTLTNLPTASLIASKLVSNGQVERFKSVSSINHISNTSMPSLLHLTSESEESSKSEHKENEASDDDGEEDDNEPIGEVLSETDIGANDRNPIPELFITPKGDSLEIGEILSEPLQAIQFAPMTETTSSESSEHTDTESDISMERRNDKKSTAKISDESESDFWA